MGGRVKQSGLFAQAQGHRNPGSGMLHVSASPMNDFSEYRTSKDSECDEFVTWRTKMKYTWSYEMPSV